MTKKNEEHVVHSLIYVGQKKGQRRRSIIPNLCASWISAFFSFSTGVLINIQLRCVLNLTYIFQKKSNDVLKNSYFDLSP